MNNLGRLLETLAWMIKGNIWLVGSVIVAICAPDDQVWKAIPMIIVSIGCFLASMWR